MPEGKSPRIRVFFTLPLSTTGVVCSMKQKFIPGIYNYCDRWCERCTFTSRCRSFVAPGKNSTETNDIKNKAFWDSVSLNLDKAMRLLHRAAKRYGFEGNMSLNNTDEQLVVEQADLIDTATRKHELMQLCKQYRGVVLEFFKGVDSYKYKARELARQVILGIKSNSEALKTVAGIDDCLDIIQWYVFFIDAKLQRALRAKMSIEESEVFEYDRDGSAKIALIAIDRSIGAWTRLYDLLPATEDYAFNGLAILGRLKNKTNEEFPAAMQFKRPGFDR
jgi:hypothetical protein